MHRRTSEVVVPTTSRPAAIFTSDNVSALSCRYLYCQPYKFAHLHSWNGRFMLFYFILYDKRCSTLLLHKLCLLYRDALLEFGMAGSSKERRTKGNMSTDIGRLRELGHRRSCTMYTDASEATSMCYLSINMFGMLEHHAATQQNKSLFNFITFGQHCVRVPVAAM